MFRMLLAFLMLLAVAPTARAGDPPGVPLQLSMFNGPSKNACLQSAAEPSQYNNRLMAAQCLAVGGTQMYSFQAMAGGGYRIVNVQTGGCMDVEWGVPHPGGRIIDWACNGQDNQRWEVDYKGGLPGIAMIRGWQSKLCLDLANGIAVQSACDYTNFSGPIWMAARQNVRQDGNAERLRVEDGGLCLNMQTSPVTVNCSSGQAVAEFWSLDPAGTTFQIRGFGKCLVDYYGFAFFIDCSGWPTTSWRLLEHSWGPARGSRQVRWQIQSVSSNRCLKVEGNSAAPGAPVITWPCEGTPNMAWTING